MRRHPDRAIVVLFLVLPIVWFNQVLWPGLSGRTMLPFDNLYAFEPWHSVRPDVVPYNPLLSDLVLESALWELQARRATSAGELPLWNPHILAGAPLLADAQGSVLYPPDLGLYWLSLPEAFAWYTALHISLAGLGVYVLCRVLALRRAAALLAGLAFMFSGTIVTGATFPQVLGVSAWLPLLFAVTELIVQHAEGGQSRLRGGLIWLGGALIVGTQFLAGHPEISVYGLLAVGGYALTRLVIAARRTPPRRLVLAAVSLLGMVVLGTTLAAAQLLPTLEAVSNNARGGARSADDLAAVAWPLAQLWTLLLPDLFGNPTHRAWLDIWSATWRPAPTTIFWGLKNYVEAGQYLGLLTWLLAVFGLLRGPRRHAAIFGALAVVAMLFVLGSPLYLVLQALPGFAQLRSPFRWMVPFTVAACVLAGLGMDVLLRRPRAARGLALVSLGLGVSSLATVGVSLVLPTPFIKLAQRFVTDPAWAERVFGKAGDLIPNVLTTPTMFWGYESEGLLRLGLVGLASGLALLRLPRWPVLALCVLVLDVFSVHGQFLPASDMQLSPLGEASRPPVITAIDQRETGAEPWRFTTFERGDEKTFLANGGMYYGWQDARGYDSIVSRWYAEYTTRLGLPIDSLTYNRIAPVYDARVLDSALLNLLNVKYVLTEQRIDNPGFREIYRDDHIAAYENLGVLPRSFVVPLAQVLAADQQPLERADPRAVVYVEQEPGPDATRGSARGTSHVHSYGSSRVALDVVTDGPAWVVLTDSWAPGWHARAVRTDGARFDLEVMRAYTALRAVHVPAAGSWTVEFSYFPDSFGWGSALSGATLVLLLVIAAGLVVMNRRKGWAVARSVPSHPLHAPYSPVGRGA